MTQAELNNLTYNELIEVCYTQERDLCSRRGQDSGLTKEMMIAINFPKADLIDMYLETQKKIRRAR